MHQVRNRRLFLPLLVALLALPAMLAITPASAEVIEEIVAWVDGDIITMSELNDEEQALIQDLYRRFSGEDLDRRVVEAKEGLLRQMIDRKILLHRAERMFDLKALADSYMKLLKRQQDVESDEELEQLLAQWGTTLEEFREGLVQRYAPDEIIRMEVGNRVAVGDKEVAAFYEANPERFAVPGKVTLREIVVLASGGDRDARRAEAAAIRDRAAEPGADFAALATELSDAGTAEEGGLLGPLRTGELAEQLEDLAFSLPVGEVGPLVEAPYGFHIIKVESREDARMQSLEEVREEVRGFLEERKYMEALEGFLQRARAEARIEVNPKYQDRIATVEN